MVAKNTLMEEGIVTVLQYGSGLNSTTLNAAISAIGSTAKTGLLITPGTWTLASNVTVTSNITLILTEGAILSPNNAVTLTINGPIQAPIEKIFGTTGTITLTSKVVQAYPQWFGAVADGATSDRTAIQRTFNASKTVLFPAGTYFLGSYILSDKIIDLSALGDGIRILTAGLVTLKVSTDPTVVGALPKVFFLDNNSHFYCDPLTFTDTGFSLTNEAGLVAFFILNNTPVDFGDLHFKSITVNGGGAGMIVASNATDLTKRIRGIKIDELNVSNCFYGYNAQNEGDAVVIDIINAYQVRRGFYVYGVNGITVNRYLNRNPFFSTGHCYIARQVAGFNTRGIKVNYIARQISDINADSHVSIDHIDLLGGEISGIDITIDIEGSTPAYFPVQIRNYTGAGGTPTAAASLNFTRDIRLAGSCDALANPVTVTATFSAKRTMHFVNGINFIPHSSVFNAFQLNQLGRASAASIFWGGSVVAPTIGNGSLTWDVDVTNGLMLLNIHMVAGSTTTFGSVYWNFTSFTLGGGNPLNKAGFALGNWYAFDSSAGQYFQGICRSDTGSTVIYCFVNAGITLNAAIVGNTVPFTWAQDDFLHMTIMIPISG